MKELEPQAEDLRNEYYKICKQIKKIPFNYLNPTHIVIQIIVDIFLMFSFTFLFILVKSYDIKVNELAESI